MPTFYVYILRCADDSLYLGQTDDLERRLADHAEGVASEYTRERLPVTLVFFEEFGSRQEAIERERQLKKWSRAKKEALIVGDWERVKQLASRRRGPSTSALRAFAQGEE